MEFDIGKWLVRIIFEPSYYSDLKEYVKHEDHLESHILSKELIEFPNKKSKVSELYEPLKVEFVKTSKESITSALDTLSRQMIVVAITLTEGMITEFAECLFFYNPNKLHDFVFVRDIKGCIPLKIVTNNSSKDQMLKDLAKNASARLLEGQFDKALGRLESISNLKIDIEVKDNLIKFSKLRNQIIHEAKYISVSEQEVTDIFDTMHKFLTWLGKNAISNNIAINDPGSLVT